MLRLEGCDLIAERLHRSSLMKDAMSEWMAPRLPPHPPLLRHTSLSACGEKFTVPSLFTF